MDSLRSTRRARLFGWAGRRLARFPVAGLARCAIWGLPLVGLELIGRRSPADSVDAVGVLGLCLLGLAAWIRFEEPIRAWLKRGPRERWLQRLRALHPRMGLDFRRTPVLPRALPRPVFWAFALSFVTAALALVFLGSFPSGARAWLQGVSGLLMLVAITGLWGVLILGTLLGFLYPLFSIDLELSAGRGRAMARRHLRMWGTGTWLLFLTGCAAWLPPQVALGALLGTAVLFAFTVSIPYGHPMCLVWKRSGDGQAACFSWSVFLAGSALAFASLIVALALLGMGDRIVGRGASESAVTAFLGTAFLWAVAGGVVYGLGEASLNVFLGRLRDPARPAPVRVHLAGGAPGEREEVGRALRTEGFQLSTSARPRSMDVPLQVVEESPGLDVLDWLQPRWPRAVAPADAAEPELHRVLRRRAEIQYRRALYRGLQLLFKRAAARGQQEGKGFWVAPHLWFVTHLSRDGDDDDLWRVGPGYRNVIAHEARHHVYTVLEALEVDLIFVEDGVGFRRLKRVLAMVFEYYDMFGGRRLEDERHFAGLPGVRVLLHEFQIEGEFKSTRYPEPDYEGVGRARVLHVFRDRGGDTSDELVPFDWDTLPMPELTLV